MRRMDRVRAVAGLGWVAVGVGLQVWALAGRGVVPGPVTQGIGVAVLVLAVTAVARLPRAGWVAGWLVAGLLGLNFAGAVADRFGVFGPPGTDRVSWGSWPAFLGYTARLLPGLGAGPVLAAAVAATGLEIALAALLISGWQRRWVGKASAGLLLVYLVSMAVTVGIDAVATYALPTLIGGALLVSASPVRRPRPVGRADHAPDAALHLAAANGSVRR